MKKRRIVIASLLKPVDDTRMFEKMGMTLADSGDFETFIIGYPSTSKPAYPTITFLPLHPFPRLSLARVFAPWKILSKVREVKPELLVVNTHDLLIVGIVNRIFFGCPFIYDIRENYFRNILHSEVFPRLLRPFLAAWVRFKELLAAPFAKSFILAEKAYENEMKFFGSRYCVIENKAAPAAALSAHSGPRQRRLLFSGTLAESTGVFRAIDLAASLHDADNSITLTIIGYVAQPSVLERIRQAVAEKPFVTLVGGSELVPHADILKAIRSADFGIITYPASAHTEGSIPTKLYEYLACQLPVLLEPRPAWVNLCAPYNACIPVDFLAPDVGGILGKMRDTFYPVNPEHVFWEGKELLRALGV